MDDARWPFSLDGFNRCACLPHSNERSVPNAQQLNGSAQAYFDDIVKAGGRGVANAHGFHDYTPEEAKLWEETYKKFSYEIRELALKYPVDFVKAISGNADKKIEATSARFPRGQSI